MNYKNKSLSFLCVILSLTLVNCSESTDTISDNQGSKQNSNLSARVDNFDEANAIFENVKGQMLNGSQAVLIAADDREPAHLNDYLQELNKTNFVANSTVHLKIDTRGQAEILDVYAVQSSTDPSHYLIVLENELFDNNVVIDGHVVAENGGFYVQPGDIVQVTNSVWRVRWNYHFNSSVFTACMEGVMGNGFIWGLSAASGFGCIPCGYAAGAYSAVALLGCAGGSVTNH